MDWKIAIIILMTVLIFSQLINKIEKSKKTDNKESYKGKYKKRNILTENEKAAYRIIKSATQNLNLQVFVKVRLADILEPKVNGKQWQTLFNKIQSKHVDFLVVDSYLNIICVLEIDDSSHDKNDRKNRDEFVDFILNDIDIQVIRKRGSFTQLELQNEILNTIKKAP